MTTLTYKLPTTRTDGTPLTPDELAFVTIEYATDDVPTWFKLADNPATADDPNSYTVPDIPVAKHWRLTVVDLQTPPLSGEPFVFDVPQTPPTFAAPGQITDFTITG